MAFTIALQTIDKGLYGNGCVFGMCKDLELFVPYTDAAGVVKNDTGRYSFASMIFYLVNFTIFRLLSQNETLGLPLFVCV